MTGRRRRSHTARVPRWNQGLLLKKKRTVRLWREGVTCWAWGTAFAMCMGEAPAGAGLVRAGSVSPSAQAARTQHQGPDAHVSHSGGCSPGSAQPGGCLAKAFPWLAGAICSPCPREVEGEVCVSSSVPQALASAWAPARDPAPSQRPHLLAQCRGQGLSARDLAPAFVHSHRGLHQFVCPPAPHRQSTNTSAFATRDSEGI